MVIEDYSVLLRSCSFSLAHGNKDKEKTDCEKFVDDMVALAAGNEGLRNGPDLWQAMSTAGDLIDSFVPYRQEGLWNPGSLTWWTSIGGNLVGQKPYIGVQSSGDFGPTGFRQELIGGGQNAQVGRHVASTAALALNGIGWGTNIANYFENRAHKGPESDAEIAGNNAGRDVGGFIGDFHNEKLSKSELKQSLMERLCE